MKAQAPKTRRKAKPAESGIAAILANSTRLELVIVAAVLLVLMLSNRAPRSGNAGVRPSEAETPPPTGQPTSQVSIPGDDTAAPIEEMPPVEMQPQTKRVAVVDARSTGNPKYKDLMYGEITVRWIWNGAKFVPQKVCVVDEGNGTTSVWSFDQQNGVTITEKQEETDTSR